MSQAKKAKVEEVVRIMFFPALVEKQKKYLHMMNPVYNCAIHMHVIYLIPGSGTCPEETRS